GQRQRARGHVLAHGELAGSVSEALAVVAQRVEGGHVGLALDAGLGERSHGLLTVGISRQLHHEHEPSARVAVRVRARQLNALDARQRFAIATGYPAARCQHLIQPLELNDPDRGRDLRQPVVESQPVVLERAHVSGAALVALGVHPLLERSVAVDDHAALAGGQLLVGVEAKHGGLPAPPGAGRPCRWTPRWRSRRRRGRRTPARTARCGGRAIAGPSAGPRSPRAPRPGPEPDVRAGSAPAGRSPIATGSWWTWRRSTRSGWTWRRSQRRPLHRAWRPHLRLWSGRASGLHAVLERIDQRVPGGGDQISGV